MIDVRILVLGGTQFLGRWAAQTAVDLGWEVVTFNRGVTAPDVAGVTAVRGDRNNDSDIARLTGLGAFDAVVDCTAYVPANTLQLARLLEPHCHRYVLVSTVSVYEDWPARPLTESSARLACPPDAGPDHGPADMEDGPTRYGRLKAGCEAAVEHVFGPARRTVLRPGVVLGPGEYVGRLPWWLTRISSGGPVIAPGDPERRIQPVDVRDVARFILHTVREGLGAVFNVAADMEALTFSRLLLACRQATRSDARLIWVSDEQLLTVGVRQWSELPLWRTSKGVWKVDSRKVLGCGLTCRPIEQTVADTWEWMQHKATAANERSAEIGLTAEHERELLARHEL